MSSRSSRLAALVAAPALSLALVTGCTGGEDDASGAPAFTDDLAGVPAEAQALCAPFRAAYARITAGGDLPSDPAEPVADDVVDAYRDLGAAIVGAGAQARPDDMTDDQAAGLAVLAGRLADLPDDATGADLVAVEDDLAPVQARQVEEARRWVARTCDVEAVGQ